MAEPANFLSPPSLPAPGHLSNALSCLCPPQPSRLRLPQTVRPEMLMDLPVVTWLATEQLTQASTPFRACVGGGVLVPALASHLPPGQDPAAKLSVHPYPHPTVLTSSPYRAS